MEFERAIFRVYERCVENIREEDIDDRNNNQGGSLTPKHCRIIEGVFLGITIFFFFVLAMLHSSFVGSSGCVPAILRETSLYNKSSGTFMFKEDQILQINLDSRYSQVSHRSLASAQQRSGSALQSNLRGSENLSLIRTRNQNSNNSSNAVDIKYDFEFAYRMDVLALSSTIRSEHNFQLINITLDSDSCFGSSFVQPLVNFGVDIVIKNFLMNTFNHGGYLVSASGQFYSWNTFDIPSNKPVGVVPYLVERLTAVLLGFSQFFYLSSMSALLVRVLISSGVVALFPVFYFIQVIVFFLVSLFLLFIN